MITYVSRFPVDDAQVTALHARAFGSPSDVVTPWSERLHRYALTWVGAFEGDNLIGFIQVCWDGGSHAFLLDTAVDPTHHHQGIGTTLVHTATTAARTAGCEWLHVDFEPHLTPFYQTACNFHPTPAGLIHLTP